MQVVDALYISRCTSLRFSLGHLRRSRIVVWARGKEAVDFCPPGTLDSWNVYQQVVRCKQPGRLQVLGWCDTKVIWHSPLYSAICLFSMDDWKNDYSWSLNKRGLGMLPLHTVEILSKTDSCVFLSVIPPYLYFLIQGFNQPWIVQYCSIYCWKHSHLSVPVQLKPVSVPQNGKTKSTLVIILNFLLG